MFKQKIMVGCLAFISVFADAAIVSLDLRTAGDGLIERDTVSGLEWLDVGETRNYSYNEVAAQFGEGGLFAGWRHATIPEVTALYAQFGFNLPYDFRSFDPAFRTQFAEFNSVFGKPDRTNFYAMFGRPEDASIKGYMPMVWLQPSQSNAGGIGIIERESTPDYRVYQHLVRVSDVPVPAAAWLLGSGLATLVGVAGRKGRAST